MRCIPPQRGPRAKLAVTRCAGGGRRRGGRRGAAPAAARRSCRSSVACGQRVWKRQPDGGVGGARHVAAQHDPLAPRAHVRVGHRHRREQRLGVGMHRQRADALGRPDLDDLAEVHHRDPVGDLAHHRQVVGDEHVGQPELVLEVLHQVDDLRAHRDVERGDGLVGDHQLRASARARGRSRCAGAGRRRTRAGSDRRARAAARRARAARARAPGSRSAGACRGCASAGR